MSIIVGIGELDVCFKTGTIKTVGLGSCVAVVIMDEVRRVCGMAHIVLPKSDAEEAKRKPTGYFADLALPRLLNEMAKHGSGPRQGPLKVRVIGGAAVGRSSFNIGKRNVLAVRKALWKAGLAPQFEDVGGDVSRTVTADVSKLEVVVTSPTRERIAV